MSRSASQSFKNKLLAALHSFWQRLRSANYSPIEGLRQRLFPRLHTLSHQQRRLLEQMLGFRIGECAYYEQALLHRSELPRIAAAGATSNERLEFLGDALLGFLTAEYLFANYPHLPEGELTKMRTWLVNRRTLAICARRLSIDRLLTMSSSARRALEHGSEAFLADALEALIAAVYIDKGLSVARRLVQERLLSIAEQEQLLQDTNYKSLLLEHLQAHGEGLPQYKVLEERGPDHSKEFVVGVYVSEQCLGIGTGRSKKDAEQCAARRALETLEHRRLQENVDGASHL
ncbi:MAG: ribonuclease III [Bacteroidota bacterium]|nr:ribonuclease III [Bacteroidota bacterium]